ncbi:MAG: Response regulator receiver [Parcubacteria group bacterium GW2011_GWB1_56_8]|nr:MAG: Response regulator receiver [Parcubacteria group bacterium GW2011_GWB1_56_8]
MPQQAPLILIIDDEPEFVEILKTKLVSVGFRVQTVSGGEEGIREIKAAPPDLVLLDMKMPGLSGADTLLKIKEDPAMKGVKVVFLTNFGDPRAEFSADEKFAKDLGAAGYLKKTDDLDAMVQNIQLFLPAGQ